MTILIFLLTFVLSQQSVFAQINPSGAVPSILTDVKAVEFTPVVLNPLVMRLIARLDASIFRLDNISRRLKSRTEILTQRGVKNSRLSRSLTSLDEQMSDVKTDYAELKLLLQTLTESSSSAQIALMKTNLLKVETELKNLFTLERSTFTFMKGFKKLDVTPVLKTTLKVTQPK